MRGKLRLDVWTIDWSDCDDNLSNHAVIQRLIAVNRSVFPTEIADTSKTILSSSVATSIYRKVSVRRVSERDNPV